MSSRALTAQEHAPGGRDGRRFVMPRSAMRWLSWLLGIATLAAVILVVLHSGEERELLRTTEHARPWWLLVAVALQAGTYFAQAESWRIVTRAGGVVLPLGLAYRLSLAKLFVDQALPSAGLSGTLVVGRALEARGVPRDVLLATLAVNTIAYFLSYAVALAVGLVIATLGGHVSLFVVGAAIFVVALGVTLTVALLWLSGRSDASSPWLRRLPILKDVPGLLGEANPRLTRSPPLIALSAGCQLAIVLLDATTMWFLILSLGAVASPSGVFASFILSTLLRTISIVPGGLGAFEAASVLTLRLAGVAVDVALAATLLFRGLSFWLPMLPGVLFARGVKRESAP